jgi:uncharacterized protein YbcI
VECLSAFHHVGFFAFRGHIRRASRVHKAKSVAQQIAEAASAFEQRRTGLVPKAVTVVVSGETLVITLDGTLSPAEKALARTPEGAAQVHEFHRLLFASTSESLRQEIKRITGVEVRQADPRDAAGGTVVPLFAIGVVVQVFLLSHKLPIDTWTSSVES